MRIYGLLTTMNFKSNSMIGIQKRFKGSKKLFPFFYRHDKYHAYNYLAKIFLLDKYEFLTYTIL